MDCGEKEEDGSQLWIIKTNKKGYKLISPKLDPNKYLYNDGPNICRVRKSNEVANQDFIHWKFENAVINTSQKNSGTMDFDRMIHKIDYNVKTSKINILKVECTYEEGNKIDKYYTDMYYFGEYQSYVKSIYDYNNASININVIKSFKMRHQQVVNRLNEWSRNCGISKNDSNRTKVWKINKKICQEMKYNYSHYYSDEWELYGEIMSGSGICATYAHVFKTMCKYWNIPVRIVYLNSKIPGDDRTCLK